MAHVYRFFPWVRRGLAASLPPASPPPLRADAAFKVTVTEGVFADRTARLLGPGDIVGIDLRLVVRTDPRPNAFDVEPNYLASIEFDEPDFPWMFTPSGAHETQQLAPWLVLIVLDAAKVELPRITPGRPLPSIKLSSAIAKEELPKLSESWAWAHAQRLAVAGDSADAAALEAEPDRNVSRLICPRHLAPKRRYFACVVPAWDAGRDAGLGVPRKVAEAPLAASWPDAIEADVELPVYYHWVFETGLQGDFETLARRLEPHPISAANLTPEEARRGRVYLGSVDDETDTRADLPPEAASSSIRFEAPLEAIDRPMSVVDETPEAFARAVDRATKPAPEDADVKHLTPPVYGDRLGRREDIEPLQMTTHWLDELNLDPRARIAARLGGDTVRRFQEDLMHVAWEQVGDVLAANDQLARSKFLAVAAERALLRNTAKLPPERILMLTSIMHRRVKVNDLTVSGRISRTSLPDRAFDPVIRRLTTPVGRFARLSARVVAAGFRVNASPNLARGLAEAFQRTPAAVDPAVKVRDGIVGYGLARHAVEQGWDAFTSPDDQNVRLKLPDQLVEADTQISFKPRQDLAETGIFTAEHIAVAEGLAVKTGLSTAEVLGRAVEVMRATPDTVRIAVEVPADRPGEIFMNAVVREPDDTFVLVGTEGVRRQLFRLDAAEEVETSLSTVLLNMPRVGEGNFSASYRLNEGAAEVAFTPLEVAGEGDFLRVGSHLSRPDRIQLVTESSGARDWFRAGGGTTNEPADDPMFTAVMPAFVTDATVTSAIYASYESQAAAMPEPTPEEYIRAAIEGTGATPSMAVGVRTSIDPATIFKRRAAMLVSIPEWIDRVGRDELDPIAAAPILEMPFADLFAKAMPDRFLPPEVSLPDDRIAALSTNPRFVAAFMVGANHEMNRELLWRTYPTDSRGTSITRFWNWSIPGRKDVEKIYHWSEAGPLVDRLSSGRAAQIAIVVRGRLLQRYPNTHVLLWKAKDETTLEDLPADPAGIAEKLKSPVFRLTFDPDISVAGFDLKEEQFNEGTGWFVVLQEPITEARFGLDDNDLPGLVGGRSRPSRNANDLNWKAADVAEGGHLGVAGVGLDGLTNSAIVAEKLLQRPVRFAIHSSELAAIMSGAE